MRRLPTLTLACSLLAAGCAPSVPPPRSGSPGAAVSQLAPAVELDACALHLRLPQGWQVRQQGGAQWQLRAPGSDALAPTLLCRTVGLDGPGDVVLEPLLGPLDTSRMNVEWARWGAPGLSRPQIVAYQRRTIGVDNDLQEAAELPRQHADPQALRALLVLRWNPLNPEHVEQRAALIAALTQSLEAPDAATGTTGTHHDQHP